MPKMKTHKGTQKRFKVTGGGIVMRTKGQKSHLRRRKHDRNKRAYDKMFPVSPAIAPHIKQLLPYGLD
jgi:large subunit ribosomal protein L35